LRKGIPHAQVLEVRLTIGDRVHRNVELELLDIADVLVIGVALIQLVLPVCHFISAHHDLEKL
jgi:hypothetical protein